MQVKIKRIDKSLPLPEYQTSGSVGFDLYSRENINIAPQAIALIPTNVIIDIPEGYMLVVVTRSSTPKRKGLLVPHGVGIVDQDYHGPEDEVLLQVKNFTDQAVKVDRGERIGQAVFVRVDQAQWQEVEATTKNQTRGGFGSTGY